MALRPCLDCGTLTHHTRCPACQREENRQREARRTAAGRGMRGYTGAWYRVSREARAAQPWCSICGSTADLTADHIVPLAQGGTHDPSNIRVLCKRCNSSRVRD